MAGAGHRGVEPQGVKRAFALAAAPVLAAASVVCAGPEASAHQSGVLLFHFTDPLIDESSGVATGSLPEGYLWTHEDSGGGQVFFAIGPDGSTAGRYQLTFGARRAMDWEDMAWGPGPDGSGRLYLADIGDNGRNRPAVTVYEVAEPDPVGAANADVVVLAAHHLVYPDGPHDAETFLVDPVSGAMGIVTKESDGRSGLYVADAPIVNDLAVDGAAVHLLRHVQTIDLAAVASPYEPWHFNETSRLLATGGAVSPDGSRLVVRTYVEAFEWALGPDGLSGGAVGAPHRIDLPPTRQGEAIGYAWDGLSLVVTSEGQFAPVHLIRAG